MIFTDSGIVLFRQDFREADRIIALYTLEHGRIHLRLPGVNHAKGKLKAFSEPFTCADYRIYTRRANVLGTITGGKINRVFPAIRSDLKRQVLTLHFCELMMRLTPLHQPSQEKYKLLLQALTELETYGANTSFSAAFTLRLMAAAGFGLDHPVLQITPEFWEKMHYAPFSDLCFQDPQDLLSLSKCNEVCRRFLNQYLTYPLQTLKSFALPQEQLLYYTDNSHAPMTKQEEWVPAEAL